MRPLRHSIQVYNHLEKAYCDPNLFQILRQCINDDNKDKKDNNAKVKNNDDDINKTDIKTYVNVDVNDDNVVNDKVEKINNTLVKKDDDYLRDLAVGKKTKKKKVKKAFTSFYMDPYLATEVDNIASRGKEDDKSKLIFGIVHSSRNPMEQSECG